MHVTGDFVTPRRAAAQAARRVRRIAAKRRSGVRCRPGDGDGARRRCRAAPRCSRSATGGTSTLRTTGCSPSSGPATTVPRSSRAIRGTMGCRSPGWCVCAARRAATCVPTSASANATAYRTRRTRTRGGAAGTLRERQLAHRTALRRRRLRLASRGAFGLHAGEAHAR